MNNTTLLLHWYADSGSGFSQSQKVKLYPLTNDFYLKNVIFYKLFTSVMLGVSDVRCVLNLVWGENTLLQRSFVVIWWSTLLHVVVPVGGCLAFSPALATLPSVQWMWHKLWQKDLSQDHSQGQCPTLDLSQCLGLVQCPQGMALSKPQGLVQARESGWWSRDKTNLHMDHRPVSKRYVVLLASRSLLSSLLTLTASLYIILTWVDSKTYWLCFSNTFDWYLHLVLFFVYVTWS